jgi:predicted Rdx family selenoprotein
MVSNRVAHIVVKELEGSLNFCEDHATVHRKLKMAIEVINTLVQQIDEMRSRPLTDGEMQQLLQKAMKVENKEHWKTYCRLIEKEHGIN